LPPLQAIWRRSEVRVYSGGEGRDGNPLWEEVGIKYSELGEMVKLMAENEKEEAN
jgi:hypothetical protein